MDRSAEEELLRRVRAGDESAFHALCERYSGRLLARIEERLAPGLRRKVGASDILQDAYLVALERLASFEDQGEGSFGRWLGGIVKMKVREAAKRYGGTGKRAIGREVAGSSAQDAVAGREPTPSEAAIGEETGRRARAAIADLPAPQREVLRLLHDLQLSLDEAARRMGRTPAAVQKLYERALASLAERMGLARRRNGP